MHAGEGAHHRGTAAAGRSERRRGAGPVPGKEHRAVELGHRVPLPTRGTSFRLRICCRSPADPPLPLLPSCSIPPPFTTERWGRALEVLPWLALTYDRLHSPDLRSSVTFDWALILPPQRRCQMMVPSSNQNAPPVAEAGRELFPPPTLRAAYRDSAPTGYAPYWRNRSYSSRTCCALLFSAAPPIRK